MQVRLYDFKHSDMENFHFITDAKSEGNVTIIPVYNDLLVID